MTTSLVWFRDDLRVSDHPALTAALQRGGHVAAVYVLDEVSYGSRPLGEATKWWLHHSLAALTQELERLGVALHIRAGRTQEHLTTLCATLNVCEVLWNRRYGPERIIDEELATHLTAQG